MRTAKATKFWTNLSDKARAKAEYESTMARLSLTEEEATDHRVSAIFATMRAQRLLHRANR